MRVTCPKCGCTEEIDSAEIGDLIECSCGKEFPFGQAEVSASAFTNSVAAVICPFCGKATIVAQAALNSNTQCESCNEKFRIVEKGFSNPPRESIASTKASRPSDEVVSAAKQLALVVAIVMVIICFGLSAILVSMKLEKSESSEFESLSTAYPRLPSSIDKFENGKIYYYSDHDYFPLTVASVVKSKSFLSNEPEGVIAIRITDYSHTAIFIEMKTDGLVDSEKLPSMNLKADGIYHYTATMGREASVWRFKRVDQH